jgi:SAM-dependent methyltransferase
VAFKQDLKSRSAADYADFLLPHLSPDMLMLDAGCGPGTITVGLADHVATVVGVDQDDNFGPAVEYAATSGIANAHFQTGDLYALDFPDAHFDACLCHSALEALSQPADALLELRRVMKPGCVLGVASVEYGGIILAGEDVEPLRRFYQIRERLWQLEGVGNPYLGRELRGLLNQCGFERVAGTTKYICYGTASEVAKFGADRASDCRDPWYTSRAISHGLATHDDLLLMERAWEVWSRSPRAYLAFPWCRAVGRAG